jgi:hypothetical protein
MDSMDSADTDADADAFDENTENVQNIQNLSQEDLDEETLLMQISPRAQLDFSKVQKKDTTLGIKSSLEHSPGGDLDLQCKEASPDAKSDNSQKAYRYKRAKPDEPKLPIDSTNHKKPTKTGNTLSVSLQLDTKEQKITKT